jgi:hypothetical protein
MCPMADRSIGLLAVVDAAWLLGLSRRAMSSGPSHSGDGDDARWARK